MNNQRRIARKKYEGNWKVMPNYESWIKYFKNSENNLANTEYYDIDYEKIGNIEEAVSVYTVPAGASGVVVISKKCKVGNKVQPLLYCVEGDHTFGLNGQHFYSANEGTRIFHSALNSEIKSYETIIHYSDGKEIRLQSNGNLLTKADGQYRLVTPLGYSILYGSKYPVILHPNGAISHSEQNYTNEMGFGLKNGEIWNVSVFKKTTVEY